MFDLEISIVNHLSYNFLENCLSSIFENTHNIKFRIYIVDNVPDEEKMKMLKKRDNIEVIFNEKILGFAENNNQVIKSLTARYILLLNPDCIILPNALDRLVEFMDNNKEIGIVGPKIFNRERKLQLSCRRFPERTISSQLAGLFHNNFIGRLFPKNRFTKHYLMKDLDHNKTNEVDWVSGSCMVMRKEVIDKIGLLDEQYKMFVEDVDYCYRAKRSGWKIVYYPDAEVIHIGGCSTSKEPIKMIIEHHKSMYKFYKKNYMVRGRLKYFIIFGLISRCLLSILENRIGYLRRIWKKN